MDDVRCVEGNCRKPAVVWLTFHVDGVSRSWPFCQHHMDRIVLRARRQRPGIPIVDKRRYARQWTKGGGT